MKLCLKYPVSLEEYRDKHEKKYGTEGVEGRYLKARMVYSSFKHIENPDNRSFAASFQDLISKPIDAFNIWWDI